MRCVIRPTPPLNDTERATLHRWLDDLRDRTPDAGNLIGLRGTTVVVDAGEELARDFAVAMMVIVGREFFYRLLRVIDPTERADDVSESPSVAFPEFGSPASR